MNSHSLCVAAKGQDPVPVEALDVMADRAPVGKRHGARETDWMWQKNKSARAATSRADYFVCPNSKTVQRIGAERRRYGDVCRVAASR